MCGERREQPGLPPGRWPAAVTRPRALALALAALLVLAGAPSARAADTQTELVPELEAYLTLWERTRLFLIGSLTEGIPDSNTTGEVGAHLDITLSPIFRRRLRDADWERERYLWLRIGYRRLWNLDDGDVTENRGVVQLTGRVPLPLGFHLVNRVGVDLRGLDDGFSTRVRERLGLECELTLGGVAVVPYVQAEVFYDTRFGAWSRQLYQAGLEVKLTDHWRIEPYYARQEDQRPSTAHVNQIGFVLKTYW